MTTTDFSNVYSSNFLNQSFMRHTVAYWFSAGNCMMGVFMGRHQDAKGAANRSLCFMMGMLLGGIGNGKNGRG